MHTPGEAGISRRRGIFQKELTKQMQPQQYCCVVIPALVDIGGLWNGLPPGIHVATMAEIKQSFATNVVRRVLYEGFVAATFDLERGWMHKDLSEWKFRFGQAESWRLRRMLGSCGRRHIEARSCFPEFQRVAKKTEGKIWRGIFSF